MNALNKIKDRRKADWPEGTGGRRGASSVFAEPAC